MPGLKRKNPSGSLKNRIWDKQHGKCWKCHKQLTPSIAEYHHKNGRRSDTREKNTALVCANCHKIISNEQRVKGKGRKGVKKSQWPSLKIKGIKIKPLKIKGIKI